MSDPAREARAELKKIRAPQGAHHQVTVPRMILIFGYRADTSNRVRMVVMHPVIPEKSFFSWRFSIAKLAVIFCVIFVVLFMIIFSIFIGGERNVLIRGKQKRTIGDIKTLASKLEDYRKSSGHYPVAADIDGVIRLLPHSASDYPYRDGWQTAYRYQAEGGDPTLCQPETKSQPPGCGPLHYILASAGADGKFSREKLTDYKFGETNEYSCDLIMRNGLWLRQPVGKQYRGACRSE